MDLKWGKIVVAILITYLSIGTFFMIFQDKRIYYPTKDCESYNLEQNGTRFYFENHGDDLIVFYHGNAGTVCDRYFLMRKLTDKGYSILFVEYTGYGATEATPSSKKIKKDVKNTIKIISQIDHKRTIVIGESIGTGPAAFHASMSDVDRLILISPYTTIADVAAVHFPIYPTSIMIRDDFNIPDYLKNYDNPMLIFHGKNDRIIPERLSQTLPMKNPSSGRILINAGHNDMYHSEFLWDELWSFVS